MSRLIELQNAVHKHVPKHIRVYDRYSRWGAHNVFYPSGFPQIKETYRQPQIFGDRLASGVVMFLRKSYDFVTGYNPEKMTEKAWAFRCLFLETIAGVPGMVGGMVRHLNSLRFLRKDRGRIPHLLEEAANERFHLFVFLNLLNPGWFLRGFIIVAQFVFFNAYFLCYLMSAKTCHRFVGHLQQQAIHTYTEVVSLFKKEDSVLARWKTIPATKDEKLYYSLPDEASLMDVVMCVRADEVIHREVNHFIASIDDNVDMEFMYTEIQEEVDSKVKQDFLETKKTNKTE